MARVGVIGLGMMGCMHLGAYENVDGMEVVAVADTDPKRAAGDLSGTWANIEGGIQQIDMNRVKGFTDPMALVMLDEVDLVDICVPTPFHTDLAVAALEAGKHVLCEKPLARTYAEAIKIARAAESATGLFMPSMCIRFWPEWTWLKNAVAAGTYGKVLSASFRRVSSMPPGWFANGEMSGGAILDLHLHDTDFVHYVFGMPKAVFSGGCKGPSGHIDHVLTNYLYKDVPVVTAEGSWCATEGFPFVMSYTVIFEKATADYHCARAEHPLMLYRDGEGTPVDAGSGDGYQAELSYMGSCIQSGTAPTIVTAADAAESIRIVEAEVNSIESGEIVGL